MTMTEQSSSSPADDAVPAPARVMAPDAPVAPCAVRLVERGYRVCDSGYYRTHRDVYRRPFGRF